MTIEQLRAAVRAEPFQPFNICLADGRQMHVPHPEFIFVLPGASRTVVLGGTDGT